MNDFVKVKYTNDVRQSTKLRIFVDRIKGAMENIFTVKFSQPYKVSKTNLSFSIITDIDYVEKSRVEILKFYNILKK